MKKENKPKTPYSQICRPFEEARSFVQRLGIKDVEEWIDYCKSGEKPNDIPHKPDRIYKNKGWKSYGDWFGVWKADTNSSAGKDIVPEKNKQYMPFEKARSFVRSLRLRNIKEWFRFCDSGKRPKDIPYNPDRAYKNSGWVSYPDWLGIGSIPKGFKYREFEKARSFVQSLGLEGNREWNEYCKSSEKPDDIPFAPYTIYAADGWISMEDWLGIEKHSNRKNKKENKTYKTNGELPFSKFRKK